MCVREASPRAYCVSCLGEVVTHSPHDALYQSLCRVEIIEFPAKSHMYHYTAACIPRRHFVYKRIFTGFCNTTYKLVIFSTEAQLQKVICSTKAFQVLTMKSCYFLKIGIRHFKIHCKYCFGLLNWLIQN